MADGRGELGSRITQPGQTALDLRMRSFREVQQALAQPLLTLEPLPPITARTIRSAIRVGGHALVATKVDHRKSITEARKGFAKIEPNEAAVRSMSYAEPDRHGIY